MLGSISPYALLCASKPQTPTSFTTPYDKRSAELSSAARDAESARLQLPAETEIHPSPAGASILQRRTHYISDIHARHSFAASRTQFAPRT